MSFVVGYAAIAWLLRFVAHHSIAPFVLYRVGLGLLLLALLGIGCPQPDLSADRGLQPAGLLEQDPQSPPEATTISSRANG